MGSFNDYNATILKPRGDLTGVVVRRVLATPLRNDPYTVADPAAVGRNHVKQGEPLLELSNGQIVSALCDGDLDWCVPVGTEVQPLYYLGQLIEAGSQSIIVNVRVNHFTPPTVDPTNEHCRWIKPVGSKVRTGEPVAEYITDEGQTILVYAPADGIIKENYSPINNFPNKPFELNWGRSLIHFKRMFAKWIDVVKLQVSLPPPKIALGTDLDTGKLVTVTTEQLCSGCYILGVQGMGKSSLLVEMGRQQLALNESVIVFDPHGQLIDDIIARMPRHRLKDTYHLDLKDREYPFGLNVFACANPDNEEERDRTRNQVIHAFEKLWPETRSGVYFKKLLRHLVILLIEHPELTLMDIPRLLNDSAFRTQFTNSLRNTGSRDFWRYDYGILPPGRQRTEASPLLTRVDELLAEPVITRILCQPRSTINLRLLIEQGKNLFIRLPVNEDAYTKAAGLVGTMLMASVYATTFSFADLPESERPGFSLIVDEFQNFATDEFARLFAQGRKFKAKQILAHQYRDQLAEASMEANKSATLTAQTKVIFSVTKADAAALAEDFVPFEQRRQPANLDITPLSAMDRHPNPVVKEFAHQYGCPLEEGTHDKITYTKTPKHRASIYAEWQQETIAHYPRRDFGADATRSFSPRSAEEALKLLDELFYFSQKAGRIDEEREALVVEKMKNFLGEDRQIAVWNPPSFKEKYEKLCQYYDALQKSKPKVSYHFNEFGWLMGVTNEEAAAADMEHFKEKIINLCLPPLKWVDKYSSGFEVPKPARSWTRHASLAIDEAGCVPYVFTGDPKDLSIPLLWDSYDKLRDEFKATVRRMITDWLAEEVIWWWKWVKPTWWWQTPEKGWFQRINYTMNRPMQWLRQMREAEKKEAQKAQKTQETLAKWEQEVAEIALLRDEIYETCCHRVAEECPQVTQFRQKLHQVVEALIADPVTVGRSTTTTKDVGLTLQHQPQRQSYVRIGTAAYVMKTLPLAERVTKQEEQQRFVQLRTQTRRTLCRHVSLIDTSRSSMPETNKSLARDAEQEPVKPAQTTGYETQPHETDTNASYQPFFEERVNE